MEDKSVIDLKRRREKYLKAANQVFRKSEIIDDPLSLAHHNIQVLILLPNADIALAQWNKGKRGVCADCDELIEPRRMEVMPRAIRCIDCQRDEEARVEKKRREQESVGTMEINNG